MNDMIEEVKVCVTAQYDKANKQFISGDENVKITVGNETVKTPEDAVKIIGGLSAPAGDGAGKDNTVAGATGVGAAAPGDGNPVNKNKKQEIMTALSEFNKAKNNYENEPESNSENKQKLKEIMEKKKEELDQKRIQGGGRSKAKRRRPKRVGTKKKKHTKRQRRYGGKTKKC